MVITELQKKGRLKAARQVQEEPHTLVDRLIEEQQSLTAVERFSQKHKHDLKPVQAKYYRDLIPIKKPSTGEQYAFEVDLDICTGCKACVAACHSQNGLHEKESWRDVGLIYGGSPSAPEQQTVTSACHHCVDPGCMNGCPVLAYEKDEETGIVRHLDDQCIGCQYCSLKCPYDVPKYDKSLGIVRKCDMCYGRLKEGEAPACVQSCPNGAIKIKVVQQGVMVERAKPEHRIISGAFDSIYTKPTTTFRTKRELPENMVAADQLVLEPEHSHLPLVWMLTLTQVGAGLFVTDFLLYLFAAGVPPVVHGWLTLLGLVFAVVGIGSSILHLGSPMGAWRSFLGLRRSWLSREIVVFGGWPPMALAAVALQWFDLSRWLHGASLVLPVAIGCAGVSLLGVFCSVMVYADTRREFWRLDRTLARFYGNVFLGGAAVTMAVLAILKESAPSVLLAMLALGVLLRVTVEGSSLLAARQKAWSYAKKSALLQLKPLRRALTARWLCLLVGLIVLTEAPVVAALFLVAGEWFARYLYFRAVAAPRMPGGVGHTPHHD